MRLTRPPLPPERRAPPPCVGDDWIVSTPIVGLPATGLKVRTRGTQSSISVRTFSLFTRKHHPINYHLLLACRISDIAHGLRNEMHFPVNWLWTCL